MDGGAVFVVQIVLVVGMGLLALLLAREFVVEDESL